MSYVALATNAFDAVTKFYGHDLGFPVVEEWDRPTGRGRRFDLLGLRLEKTKAPMEQIFVEHLERSPTEK